MRVIAAGVAALAALAGLVSCGGGGSSPSSPAPSGPVTINIVGERGAQSFSPNPALVAGQTVVFRNTDSVVHRVQLNDLSIDTGDIAPGATSRAVTMPAAGQLFLGINDNDFSDNSGEFRVEITRSGTGIRR